MKYNRETSMEIIKLAFLSNPTKNFSVCKFFFNLIKLNSLPVFIDIKWLNILFYSTQYKEGEKEKKDSRHRWMLTEQE